MRSLVRAPVVAMTVALVLLLSSCSRAPEVGTTPVPWAAAAETWWLAEQRLGNEGLHYLARFWSPDVVLDDRCCSGDRIVSRDAALGYAVDRYGTTMERRRWASLYLSPALALAQYGDFPRWWSRQSAVPLHESVQMVSVRSWGGGRISSDRGAVSWGQGRFMVDDAGRDRYDAAHDLFVDYLRGWSGDDSALRSLYAPEASVVDGITRLRLNSRREILGYDSWLRAPQAQRLPVIGGHAVYLAGDRPGRVDTVVGLVRDLDATCPGPAAVVLHLDRGRVVSETRLHELYAARTCFDGEAGPTGWWDDVGPPPSTGERQTGTVPSELGPIPVFNGSPGLERLAARTLSRFTDAGLEQPRISAVTFNQWTRDCEGVSGWARGPAAGDILVCLSLEEACDDAGCRRPTVAGKRLLLHEFAHALLARRLDNQDQVAFLRLTGLTGWDDPQLRWEEQGTELAAETVVWGLMDEPVDLRRFGSPDCGTLTAGFTLLTGAVPLSPSC